jgi:mycothiol synthase
MRATAADDARAARLGFSEERALVQMRVPLPLPPEVTDHLTALTTRPFRSGRDNEVWLDVNNRAFAGHPEQGGWTAEQLSERLSADWVDLRGFLVADAPDGHGILGSCWTKIHRHNHPPLGEIYVISVDPKYHGEGWGKALTVAGLAWLAAQGITNGMLYTEADNTPAISLYRSLGFAVDHVDRSYVHASSSH